MLECSGFRKAEWCAAKSNSFTLMVFRQVAYCFDGSEEPVRRPSKECLTSPHWEVWLYLYPVPSKCDPDGGNFCTKAIPIKLVQGDETVQLFLDEELRMHEDGCSDEQRNNAPLFSSAPGVAFYRSAMDDALAAALRLFIAVSLAAFISWHSYRIRLACKVKASGCDNPTVQAIVRWNTDKAIAIYARFERDYHWGILQKAAGYDATSVQFTALPEVDEQHRIVARLGLTGQSEDTIATAVTAIANGQPMPPLPAAPSAASQAPSPAGPRASRASRRQPELPVGWVRRDTFTQGGRAIPHFIGPNGLSARSYKEALRLFEQQATRPVDSPPSASREGSALGAASLSTAQPAPTGSVSRARTVPSLETRSARTSNAPGFAHPQTDFPQEPDEAARPHSSRHTDLPCPQVYELQPGLCGTLGCAKVDGHLGVCTPYEVLSSRRTRS